MAPEWGFEVEEIPKQDIDAVAVSSTRIRRALHAGEVELARQLLGYCYPLEGTVVAGRMLGRSLGFPTANLRVEDPDKLVPMDGVYAVWVEWEGQSKMGALNIGIRPTFDNGARSIEVHLLDFSGDLYGKKIRIRFAGHIRAEMKFDSVDDLVQQLRRDCESCRELLENE
jgi:riboflavin kinase/FMN adenylyltransferase